MVKTLCFLLSAVSFLNDGNAQFLYCPDGTKSYLSVSEKVVSVYVKTNQSKSAIRTYLGTEFNIDWIPTTAKVGGTWQRIPVPARTGSIEFARQLRTSNFFFSVNYVQS